MTPGVVSHTPSLPATRIQLLHNSNACRQLTLLVTNCNTRGRCDRLQASSILREVLTRAQGDGAFLLRRFRTRLPGKLRFNLPTKEQCRCSQSLEQLPHCRGVFVRRCAMTGETRRTIGNSRTRKNPNWSSYRRDLGQHLTLKRFGLALFLLLAS